MRVNGQNVARVVAALLGVTAFALFAAVGNGTPRRYVPNVTGLTRPAAIAKLERNDLRARVFVDPDAPQALPPRHLGRVVFQTWRRGVALPMGTPLRLTVYPKTPGQARRWARR